MPPAIRDHGRTPASTLHVPAATLPAPQIATLMGRGVEVYGTSGHNLNGKRGVATDFHCYQDDPTRNRYSVLLDSGETYKFKPTAVRPERVGAAGGARPKAKGKGKKGRGKGGRRGLGQG